MLGMLIGMLDQGVAYAVHVTTMQSRRGDRAADLPVADATLRRLVAHADPGVYPEPASLKGTSTSLTMVTDVAGADGASRPVDAALFASEGSIRLRLSVHRHVDRLGTATPAETLVLIEGVTGLAIDYADAGTGTWRPSWSADVLPALVRFRLVFADGVQRWPPMIVATRREAPGQ